MPHHLFSHFDSEGKTILGQCLLPFRCSLSYRKVSRSFSNTLLLFLQISSIFLGGILLLEIEASKENINSRGKYFSRR